MTAIRVQRRRTKGWKMPENTIYVGRPTKWGNPWSVKGYWSAGYIGDVKVAAAATVEQFRAWMTQTRSSWSGDTPTAPWALPGVPESGRKIPSVAELRGKNLACWCPLDQPCHADILLALANGRELPLTTISKSEAPAMTKTLAQLRDECELLYEQEKQDVDRERVNALNSSIMALSGHQASGALARQWRLLLALDAAAAEGLTFDQITASGACSERTAHQDVDTLILAGFPVEVRTESQPRVFLDRASWQGGEGTIFNRQGH